MRGEATELDRRLRAIVEPMAEAMGFEIVRVRLASEPRRSLQIMAERPDGTMVIDDCVELSHALSALLDVEDPIRGEYELEVSSPGIDRPLTREKDFTRWAGFEARIELTEPREGRRRFRGRLLGVEGAGAVLEVADLGRVALDFDAIERAKLVLTDDLMKAAAQGAG